MRIVVKIGSSSLVDDTGTLRMSTIGTLVDDIGGAVAAGHEVVLVSSGAIATGLGLLGHTSRPRDLPSLQAASAVGQGALFGTWSMLFERSGLRAAQVLLTMHDASYRASWVNARNTFDQLLAWGTIPVVNENDTTATDEITFGDNDTLAAQVAVSINADALVLLTDTDGLYTEHPSSPGAQLIDLVEDRSLLHRIDTATPGSHWGSGGMRSKVIAAEMASVGGTETFITRAGIESIVVSIGAGEHVGTRVVADGRRGSSFKLWLRYAKRAAGSLTVDAGARRAIVESGASLLPVGIVAVDGDFTAGDAVAVVDENGIEFARGICEYAAADVARLIAEGGTARGVQEAIHRDQLAVFAPAEA